MRAFVTTLAAAVLAAGTVVMAAMPASAAPVGGAPGSMRPAVQPGDCGALAAKLGPSKVWQASFEMNFRGDNFDPPEYVNTQPCFASYKDCFNWLYNEQSNYPSQDQNVGFCKRGMPYG